jgi:diaminopimelate epimerase
MMVAAPTVKEMQLFRPQAAAGKGGTSLARGCGLPIYSGHGAFMSALANHPFFKMNGLGNEIVVVDLRGQASAIGTSEARIVAQSAGAACDQLMTLHTPRSAGSDAYVRIYNRDGSEAGACGNGVRCVAELLFAETGKRAVTLETKAGLLDCWKGDAPLSWTVDMGAPRFAWHEVPLAHEVQDTRAIPLRVEAGGQPLLHSPSALSMGNPHAIFWVGDVAAYDLGKIGPRLEHDPIFPERANISLAEVRSREHIIVRTWERGAGLTKACGSAACAAAVAAARTERSGRRVTVSLPGGDLLIEWRARDGRVLMTGPVEHEYQSRFDPALFAEVRSL